MARPLRIQYPGALYHVTHRGNERKEIFKDDLDRQKFIQLLARSLDIYSVKLYSFVLMNNHFHLLVETPLGNLSEFMRHFNISYTSAFNRRYQRSGNLYQGRYKSFLVDHDGYLTMVSRYIHLNPVKIKSMQNEPFAQRLDALWQFRWSSLPGFFTQKKRYNFINYDVVLAEYGGDTRSGRACYKKQLAEDLVNGLQLKDKVIGQSLLGGEKFITEIKSTYLDRKSSREQPALAEVKRYLSKEAILDVICKKTGKSTKDLLLKPGGHRHLTMDLLYRLGGMKNPEIGKMMNIDYSTVSVGRKRFREKVACDDEMQKMYIEITNQLSRLKI